MTSLQKITTVLCTEGYLTSLSNPTLSSTDSFSASNRGKFYNSRHEGAKSARHKRLLSADYMLRDHEPESLQLNPTRPEEFTVLLKPSPEAMKIALRAAKVDPRRTLFLDDNASNIAAGKTMGLHTVLVGKRGKSREVDYAVENVNQVAELIPEIWGCQPDGQDQRTVPTTKSEFDSMIPTTTATKAVGA